MTPALTNEGTSRTVETTSWKLHYNEAGEGHPVILLHGSGPGATGWSNFSPNIATLAQDFRVLALDAPGWGGSDAATSDKYDHPAAVLGFMDALGIEKAALIGNSMGGMTALTFAARYPDRISHLITMGSGSFFMPTLFGPNDGPSEGLKILQEGYRNPTREVMKRLVEIMSFSAENATDELAQQRADNAAARPDHLQNFLTSFVNGPGPVPTVATPAQLQGITTPTLLIHGRDDRVVHFEHSLRLVSMISNSRLVLLNRCGHWAQLEHSAEFNRMVRDFVVNS
jgi:2-hydroxy-6-oxonona-2,4-dienedioate hydrolase